MMNVKLCVTAALLGLILAVDGAGATGKQQHMLARRRCYDQFYDIHIPI